MLKDLGVEYVIVGHSERRRHFGETNEVVNKKLKAVLEAGLTAIFCIGENEGENKGEVLEKQITGGLGEIFPPQRDPATAVTNLVVAYEPVWAIGTGNNCSPEETKSSIEMIKSFLPKGSTLRILYGGSVISENSASYIKEAGADGLLVGGASLKAEEFIKIVSSIKW
jgi:triosephosphate isomerase